MDLEDRTRGRRSSTDRELFNTAHAHAGDGITVQTGGGDPRTHVITLNGETLAQLQAGAGNRGIVLAYTPCRVSDLNTAGGDGSLRTRLLPRRGERHRSKLPRSLGIDSPGFGGSSLLGRF